MAKIYGSKSVYIEKMIEASQLFVYIYLFVAGAGAYALTTSIGSSITWSISGVVIGLSAFIVSAYVPFLLVRHGVKTLLVSKRKFSKGEKGESAVYFRLRDYLPSSFTVIQNVSLPGRGNVDFVVIGQSKVFIVEVKSHSGVISFDGEKLTRNGKPFEKDILRQAKAEAANVSEYIKDSVGSEVWVDPVVVFTGHNDLHFGMKKVDGVVYVVGLSWLIKLVRQYDVGSSLISEQTKDALVQLSHKKIT